MKSFLTLLTCLIIFSSCNSRHDFWNISKFNIVDSALKDNEEIKLLYTSQGPDDNRNQEYYIHIVAVSQKTGDTVNILTSINNGFSMADKDKVFNYFDQNNIASKLSALETEDLTNPAKLDEASNKEAKKIIKVARDTKFDKIADNKFPTVIGTIGKFTKPN